MRIRRQFLAIFFCFLLCLPPVTAQSPQSGTSISKDVTIMIERQQVRFTAQKAVEEMRLQVFDPAGELIYDSGSVTQPEINWSFQNGNGETVKSGLYTYTLSIKGTGQEAAQVRRGHFIVDRAKDRDNGADKLWVTSQNDNGVGAELAVARDENVTVAGASVPTAEPGRERTNIKHDTGIDERSKSESKNDKQAAEAALIGETGKLAKFISPSEIGSSEISEVSTAVGGMVGIGTTTPSEKLTVRTGSGTYGVTHTDGGVSLSTWIGGSDGYSGGWIGTKSYDSLNFFTANGTARMTINPNGNIGIGTVASPLSRVTIDGQDALMLRGYEPFLNIQDANSLNNDLHRIQSAHGDLNFFHGYLRFHGTGQLPGYVWTPRMVIKNTGNIGIGTAEPGTKLHVSSDEARLRLESSRSDLWTVTEYVTDARQWHTGVGGSNVFNGLNNKYYIFDATAGRARLTIDTAGLVSVDMLQINGADFAERFDVGSTPAANSETSPLKVEAGMVVSIDPANPGKLLLSTQPFDPRVAGIISGAGGVRAGMIMGQEGTLADGQYPVALTGRVYCWVDATQATVEPGDLLTTSSTPGHAMKASDTARAQGAIIGKAMTGLKEGKGLVLVLVTLR